MMERVFGDGGEGRSAGAGGGKLGGACGVFDFNLSGIADEEGVQRCAVGFDPEAVRWRKGEAFDRFGVTEILQPVENLGLLIVGELSER